MNLQFSFFKLNNFLWFWGVDSGRCFKVKLILFGIAIFDEFFFDFKLMFSQDLKYKSIKF